jgi:endonuclease/exonuclease/phosphatase family metal-dependent hydrolase
MQEPLRLLSFNILEGLRPLGSPLGERRQLDRKRTQAAQDLVATLHPDMLVLNEALFCSPFDGHHVEFARLFDFPHVAAALYDGPWGNAILSRLPIASTREWRIPGRGGLIVVVDTPGGRMTLASYHPHPHRMPESKALDFIDFIRDVEGPAIICGDLNCINPEDELDRDELIVAFRSFSSRPEWAVDQFIKSGRLVFASLKHLGFMDAIPGSGRRHSIPTDLINTNKVSAIRIDHILANREIEIVAGEVVHSPASNLASDHHPVMLDFRITQS